MESWKSDLCASSTDLIDENMEADELQFPGVTDTNMMMPNEDNHEYEEEMVGIDVEEEEDIEEEVGEECFEEDLPLEEEEEEREDVPAEEQAGHEGQKDQFMKCRSIKIGSLEVHPNDSVSYYPVQMNNNSLTFKAPTFRNSENYVTLFITSNDVICMLAHFGKNATVFVFTTEKCGEAIRNKLCISEDDYCYFDPISNDEKRITITFLIDSITEDQREYLQYHFCDSIKIKKIDQKTASEILVRSTPNQQNLSVKRQPQEPSAKILTYPPPPETGRIEILNKDLACLNEGEFLNDVIIDFYLKYVFREILTDCQREKTYIFSSYFYPRLTHKPERRVRSSDDDQKKKQFERHSQVKTWTRHVDIFSKDYIIIPINQDYHWFLAIICFPGHVPDASSTVPADNAKVFKSADSGDQTSGDKDDPLKAAMKDGEVEGSGNSETHDENSTISSSIYEVEELPDSKEDIPEAPDNTHPDGNHGSGRLKTPCICIFDSLSRRDRTKVVSTLREYLEMEWKVKKGTKQYDGNNLLGCIVPCPQQTNYFDCGVYLLQYVESFFQNPLPCFENPMPDLSNWFTEDTVNLKRYHIKDLILNLQQEVTGDIKQAGG